MLEKINPLLSAEPDEWLSGLSAYQAERIKSILGGGATPSEAAEKWLKATPAHTYPFGADKGKNVFIEKIWEEIEKFVCGGEEYKKDRENLLSQNNITHTYFVGVIAVAIAPVLGSSSVFLAPVVALLFASLGKVTLNAWCEARKSTTD